MAELQIRRVGETQRLFQPLIASLNWVVGRIGWIVGVLAVLYAVSGVTFVRENEVALVLRFGRLVGETPERQVNRPGLLLALPFPVDRVVRVPTDLVREVRVVGLDATDRQRSEDPRGEEQGDRIAPEEEGYVVTGDRFVMQTRLVARYRVKDAVAFALGGDLATRELLVEDVVQSAALERLTRYQSVELFAGLRSLPAEVRDAAQRELDALAAGVELVEVQIGRVLYPRQVMAAVSDVTSAYAEAGAAIQEARGFRGQQLEYVRRILAQVLNEERAYAQEIVARTRGTIEAYRELQPQYASAPRLVRERLLRAGLARILRESGARVTLAPPPAGERYNELRITITPSRRLDAVADGENP